MGFPKKLPAQKSGCLKLTFWGSPTSKKSLSMTCSSKMPSRRSYEWVEMTWGLMNISSNRFLFSSLSTQGRQLGSFDASFASSFAAAPRTARRLRLWRGQRFIGDFGVSCVCDQWFLLGVKGFGAVGLSGFIDSLLKRPLIFTGDWLVICDGVWLKMYVNWEGFGLVGFACSTSC